MKVIVTPRTVVLIVIYILLLIAEPLSKTILYTSYLDELIGLTGWLLLFISFVSKRGSLLSDYYKKIITFLAFIVLIGFISNYFSGISRTMFNIALDTVSLTKFLGAFMLGDYLSKKKSENDNYVGILEIITKINIIIALVFWIIHLFINIGMTSETRFGIRDFCYIYENSGAFSNYCIIYFLVLSINIHRKNKFFKGLCVLLLLTTLRFKAFGVVAVICVLKLSDRLKDYRYLKYLQFVGGALVSVIVGWDQFSFYYLESESTPRALLLKYGFETARRFFPLGAGFGTYGSGVAATYYSPLYEQYGFINTWALGIDGRYLNDNFWPMICGQFGWIGFTLYLLMCINLYKIFIRNTVSFSNQKNAIIILFATIIIASLGGPIMVNIFAVAFFFVTAVIVNNCNYDRGTL